MLMNPPNFKQVNLQERDLQGGLGGNERTILEWILKDIGISTSHWVYSAEDMGNWRSPVNAELILRVS